MKVRVKYGCEPNGQIIDLIKCIYDSLSDGVSVIDEANNIKYAFARLIEVLVKNNSIKLDQIPEILDEPINIICSYDEVPRKKPK